jgi:hypothetical protein
MEDILEWAPGGCILTHTHALVICWFFVDWSSRFCHRCWRNKEGGGTVNM